MRPTPVVSRRAAWRLLCEAVPLVVLLPAEAALPGRAVKLTSPLGGVWQFITGFGDGCPWGRQHYCHGIDRRSECTVGMESEVLTGDEANFVISETERFAEANGWSTRRHAAAPTVDLPHYLLPSTWPLLNRTFDRVVGNAFRRCGLEQERDGLKVEDLFIVKYSLDGQPGLKTHRDGSFMSFNLHLSSPQDHEGGGTHFTDLNETFKIPRGSVLMHGGAIEHTGVPVTSGTRYIAVGFLSSTSGCCITFKEWAKEWGKRAVLQTEEEAPNARRDALAARVLACTALLLVVLCCYLASYVLQAAVDAAKRAYRRKTKVEVD